MLEIAGGIILAVGFYYIILPALIMLGIGLIIFFDIMFS